MFGLGAVLSVVLQLGLSAAGPGRDDDPVLQLEGDHLAPGGRGQRGPVVRGRGVEPGRQIPDPGHFMRTHRVRVRGNSVSASAVVRSYAGEYLGNDVGIGDQKVGVVAAVITVSRTKSV